MKLEEVLKQRVEIEKQINYFQNRIDDYYNIWGHRDDNPNKNSIYIFDTNNTYEYEVYINGDLTVIHKSEEDSYGGTEWYFSIPTILIECSEFEFKNEIKRISNEIQTARDNKRLEEIKQKQEKLKEEEDKILKRLKW